MNAHDTNHEYYQQLCALASLGQLTAQEHKQLQIHLKSCASCAVYYSDFQEILHEHLPLLGQTEGPSPTEGPVVDDAGMRARFFERAAREGIGFSPAALRTTPSVETQSVLTRLRAWFLPWPPSVYAVSAGFAVFTVTLVLLLFQLQQSRSSNASALQEIGRLRTEIARMEGLNAPTLARAQTPESNPPQAVAPKADQGSNDLRAELADLRARYAQLTATSRALDAQLAKASEELLASRQEAPNVEAEHALTAKLRETEQALERTMAELTKLRRQQATDALALADQNNKVRELTAQLSEQTETLERERELLSAGRDIRELMGARNLHIIDVVDVDSDGANKGAFGRVFYTEGKSLIFYAYDLEKKKVPREKFSFQAWGQRETRTGSAQSLGIFYAEDQSQSRWVLKFDDPKVLAQIDSVFVTVEPKGGSSKPKGQQLMYAYLKANPNHP
ncbi:MAG: hypothetical protein AB1898_09800 [Acidobacteriota bacterium]